MCCEWLPLGHLGLQKYDRDEKLEKSFLTERRMSFFIRLSVSAFVYEIQCDLTQAIEGKVCLIGTEVCFEEAASLKQVACQTLAMKHSSELHARKQASISLLHNSSSMTW